MSESECVQNGDSEFEFFNHQIIANLPLNATEMVSFPRTYEIFTKSRRVENLL